MTHDELVEKVARSDAEFDGRPWDAMPSADRKRYASRARKSMGVVREAIAEPTDDMAVIGAIEISDAEEASVTLSPYWIWSVMLAASPLNGGRNEDHD